MQLFPGGQNHRPRSWRVADPNAKCNEAIVGGVLGALVALLLAYGVVATIVIAVMIRRNRRGRVSIDQPVCAG